MIKLIIKLIVLIIVCLELASCYDTIKITVNSNPTGAKVYSQPYYFEVKKLGGIIGLPQIVNADDNKWVYRCTTPCEYTFSTFEMFRDYRMVLWSDGTKSKIDHCHANLPSTNSRCLKSYFVKADDNQYKAEDRCLEICNDKYDRCVSGVIIRGISNITSSTSGIEANVESNVCTNKLNNCSEKCYTVK